MAVTNHSLMLIALGILAVNALAFAAFWWDKRCARNGQWRIPESTLLLLALLGGSPGAFAGRALFRHKTRKQPFVAQLYGVVVVQIAAAAWWYFQGVALV